VNRFTLVAEDAAGLRSTDLALSCFANLPPTITALQAEPSMSTDGSASVCPAPRARRSGAPR
jgi:hypothetical protein